MNSRDQMTTPAITPRVRYVVKRMHSLHVGRRAACRTTGVLTAFTLIEILIVVVILAIAAVTAIPMMSSAGGVQMRSAANMIAADLEYAKSMAISRGQNYSVVFDKTAESYRIEDKNGNVIPHPVKRGFNYIVAFKEDGLEKVDILNVDFNSTSRVQFDCLGSPDNGGTVSLKAGNITSTITVETVTGYVWIAD